jgi:hypothetical protein
VWGRIGAVRSNILHTSRITRRSAARVTLYISCHTTTYAPSVAASADVVRICVYAWCTTTMTACP